MRPFSHQRPASNSAYSSYSTMSYEHDDEEQTVASADLPWASRQYHQSTTLTEIVDMYGRPRPNYESIALANPFRSDTQPAHNTEPSSLSRQRIPIPPLPELVGPFTKPAAQQTAQMAAINSGLYQKYTPCPYTSQTIQHGPANGQFASGTTRAYNFWPGGHAGPRFEILSRPLDTKTPADKRWEGSWLRHGTLRFDTKAQKKLDRAALKQEKKDERLRLKAEKKEAKKWARMVKEYDGH